MTKVILKRRDRHYFGRPESIAKRVLRDEYSNTDPSPFLLADTASEVAFYGEAVPAQGANDVFILVFDADGEEAELPLNHPLVDEDTLRARAHDVRTTFLPDAHGPERAMYTLELLALRRELKNRGTR